jgi:chromosomal replication initiator protein
MSPEMAWKATLGELELQMTRATFNTWLKDARLLSAENNEFTVGVRNDYAKDWLENRLKPTILRTLTSIVGYQPDVNFVVSGAESSGQNGNGSAESAAPASSTARYGDEPTPPGRPRHNLNPRYIFSTFVVGHNNRLAHAASLSVAEQPGQTYNPLFIYGGVGLGKTHLLHAIGNKCMSSGNTVLYVSSETFTNDLIQSIRSQTTAEFREKYRTPDVLLIDDIQFIAGKESTQEELFHTFNELHSRGKQVVISSDRPPKAMVTLEERLQSRFEWGLMADIQLPDQETRMAILQTKAEESGVNVPRNVLNIISHHVRNNIRELEGALNKVIAYSQLTGEAIDEQLVQRALADLIRAPEKVNIDQVIEAVAHYYHVSIEDLHGSGRKRSISMPRQVAMYLCRTETDASLPQIGTKLGGRDHTTIMHGHSKIENKVQTDANLRRDILEIKAGLYDAN